ANVAYNVNPVADQFEQAFQTSTISNRLYSFFNKCWFFDQVFNDFLVRLFLHFGYEVFVKALNKGTIEILGPYGISCTFWRLAERIIQLQSGFVIEIIGNERDVSVHHSVCMLKECFPEDGEGENALTSSLSYSPTKLAKREAVIEEATPSSVSTLLILVLDSRSTGRSPVA
uniref:NADH dehydrogenase subunit 5 C-terminal domain-containing protein n=1 Tax=Solanum lycopersicum TaxID=4081 RepID=A0A3Q7IVU6_SOLLC